LKVKVKLQQKMYLFVEKCEIMLARVCWDFCWPTKIIRFLRAFIITVLNRPCIIFQNKILFIRTQSLSNAFR